jgi:uncharacterized protein
VRRCLIVLALTAAVVGGSVGSALATHVLRDVAHGSAHADAIHWAHAHGVVTGYPDGTYRPRATITRDQAASMFLRYDQLVDRKIASVRAGALPDHAPFSQSSVMLDPGGVHVPKPVYVADRDELRRRGLMGVRELPREGGMLFLFPADTRGGFWMKDTLIPLSIAYFDAGGRVLAIMDMEPCTADPCPSYDPGVAYRGALEVNRGRFEDLGLAGPGWRVDVPEQLRP